MRNIVLFFNLRTNKKLFLSNRKLAHGLYVKICDAENYPSLSYPRFAFKITKEPIRFLDIEATYAPLHNPLATENLDSIYQHIVTSTPVAKIRENLLKVSEDSEVPTASGSNQESPLETDTGQTSPGQ